MTAVPTPRTWAAGEVISSSRLNVNISDVLSFLANPPILQARQIVAQSVANSSGPGAALTYTDADVDPYGMHSTSVNTSRGTAIYAGRYKVGGSIGYAANATGQRGAIANVNAASINSGYGAYLDATGSGICIVPFKDMFVYLNVGDYFEWFAVQTSGGALNTSISANNQSILTMDWRSN